MVNYHGKAFIEEQLGHVRFKIGPKSFFQTNSKQAKILYDKVVEFAELKGTENVYDLYTGIGSIALYVAKNCKQVVGIEEVADAIKDAKENAALNEIENVTFYAGDVKDILTKCKELSIVARTQSSSISLDDANKIKISSIPFVSRIILTQLRVENNSLFENLERIKKISVKLNADIKLLNN